MPPCRAPSLQELASQGLVIESLRAELATAGEEAAAAAAQAVEAAVAARDEEVKKFKLQLVKAKKLRSQDAERWGFPWVPRSSSMHCSGAGIGAR